MTAGPAYGADVDVSVVIPTLDVNSNAVRECIQHVKATINVSHELIVIDNGAPPQGFTAPVNAGLRAARARHLVVLNDDVEVLDGWWEPLARALEDGNPVVFPRTVDDVRENGFQAWCFALRRDTLEHFSFAPGEFLDPSLSVWYSDTDLRLRLSAAGVAPVLVPESRIRHDGSRTVDLEHPDDGYRTWLHAQIASDRAAFQVKHPLYPGGPRPAMTAEHRPVDLSDGPITLHAHGPGWHSRALHWPSGAGHFFLTGELALSAGPEEISVQFVFTDDEDLELFYFNLVPGAVGIRAGHFCLPRERAREVPEQFRGEGAPAWQAASKIVVRCCSERHASAVVTNLRAFAEPAAAPS
jgi:hypothetical protein